MTLSVLEALLRCWTAAGQPAAPSGAQPALWASVLPALIGVADEEAGLGIGGPIVLPPAAQDALLRTLTALAHATPGTDALTADLALLETEFLPRLLAGHRDVPDAATPGPVAAAPAPAPVDPAWVLAELRSVWADLWRPRGPGGTVPATWVDAIARLHDAVAAAPDATSPLRITAADRVALDDALAPPPGTRTVALAGTHPIARRDQLAAALRPRLQVAPDDTPVVWVPAATAVDFFAAWQDAVTTQQRWAADLIPLQVRLRVAASPCLSGDLPVTLPAATASALGALLALVPVVSPALAALRARCEAAPIASAREA